MTIPIGQRIRDLRELKNLSQGDVEKETGLLRVYISRVECGHTVPYLESIEKFARAFRVPLYQLFINLEDKIPKSRQFVRSAPSRKFSRRNRKQDRYVAKFRRLLSKMSPADRILLLSFATNLANRKK
jgi:transcriptional regulator with XRE-family HTH domain